MHQQLYVADRAALADATDLIETYGTLAAIEAANRADRSRSLGNLLDFCRWRQIERAIEMLGGETVTGTVH